jgi:hemolysin activation/secretion protein
MAFSSIFYSSHFLRQMVVAGIGLLGGFVGKACMAQSIFFVPSLPIAPVAPKTVPEKSLPPLILPLGLFVGKSGRLSPINPVFSPLASHFYLADPPQDRFLPPSTLDTITVVRFEFIGSTIFSDRELAAITANFTGRPITFDELLQARSAVTKLYVDKGYVTSGAYIPPQTLDQGIVNIKIIEGSLESINVKVDGKLDPDYVRDRLAIATEKPLSIPRLINALQLLQLDPLISKISAELASSALPGHNILDVKAIATPSFKATAILDNGRPPTVGSFRRGGELADQNLTGVGDNLQLTYLNTDGSDDVSASYGRPLNAQNGRLDFTLRAVTGTVIYPEIFKPLNINSNYQQFKVAFQQPIVQTPNQSLVLGLTLDHQVSRASYLNDLPFPGFGTDLEGWTTLSTLRFFQAWTQRSEQSVLALRSEFNWGLDVLGATRSYDAAINPTAPRTQYWMWRGQGQWVKLLAPDLLFLIRGDLQLVDRPVVSLEQFSLGGLGSVLGYRQNTLLTDNGFFGAMELRVPVLRVNEIQGILQIVPFLDFGTGWNIHTNPDPNTLASVGLGLLWQAGDRISARLDWGVPLGRVPFRGNSWQDNGITFSIIMSP